MPRHVLTLTCPDRPGIVHAVSGAILELGGNLIENAQFGDEDTGFFCMRMDFELPVDDATLIRTQVLAALRDDRAHVTVTPVAHRPRVLIMVSKYDHCLVDLLYRWRNDELRIDIPLIVSNHPDCERVADWYGIPYVHLPVTKETKAAQETALLGLVAEHRIDLVVLARYMQVLSDDLCTALAGRAINIHHSFLPGFKGAKPYHQAYERGVKLVGATAHFVTAELDEGPIIEQDVARVDHAHSVDELIRVGRDTERLALSRAVRYWAENRIILLGHKTVVFP